MSHDEIIEQATKVMHAEVCCPCDPQGCDWTHTPEARYARALADAGLLARPLPDREEVIHLLKREFWPFLAHDPAHPARFWGYPADAVLALLKGQDA